MNNLLCILPVLALSVGCISANAQSEVAAHETLHFDPPALAALPHISCDQGAPVLTTTTSCTFNVSDVFNQLQKQGSLTVQFDENSLFATEGSMSAFKYAELHIVNVNDNGASDGGSANVGSPELLAKTNFVAAPSGKINVPIVLDNGTLFQMLSAGKVSVQTTLEACATDSAITVEYTLASSVNLEVNKSL
jgi:hypothetical protein